MPKLSTERDAAEALLVRRRPTPEEAAAGVRQYRVWGGKCLTCFVLATSPAEAERLYRTAHGVARVPAGARVFVEAEGDADEGEPD